MDFLLLTIKYVCSVYRQSFIKRTLNNSFCFHPNLVHILTEFLENLQKKWMHASIYYRYVNVNSQTIEEEEGVTGWCN